MELANTNLIWQSDESCVEAVSTLMFFNGSQTPIRSKPSPLNISLKSIDSTELSWYLERYAQWPTGSFRKRAETVEQALPVWGQMLCESITADETASRLFHEWRSSSGRLKFTVQVNMNESVQLGHSTLPAAKLLGLPWELMHDGRNFILHGKYAVVLRRQIGSINVRPSPSELPVRILVVSPRPEDDQASYIDHRSSALPLLQALEGAVDFKVKMLAVPTFEELNQELRRFGLLKGCRFRILSAASYCRQFFCTSTAFHLTGRPSAFLDSGLPPHYCKHHLHKRMFSAVYSGSV